MSHLSHHSVVQATTIVRAMDGKHKEQLADELFRVQPNLLGTVLVQTRLGVSPEKMEFLLNILFVCFQAMKVSGLRWPLITEDEIDRQSQRFVGSVQFTENLGENLRNPSMRQYVEDHPEKELLAYVQVETMNWLKRIVQEETDKYVILAAWNIVNCIAFSSVITANSK
ncbi:MAG: hypothetical protein A3F78_14075 [Burkholderiales bacterium RIFCSPLOWO2_12_FULL_61_40]|nr:MAG: hypothetical protein A3F78_14075 [Burkholderiales bacterium RIFCSPLOWO2_12_FULL_61_40]